jgi:hypothetical protein
MAVKPAHESRASKLWDISCHAVGLRCEVSKDTRLLGVLFRAPPLSRPAALDELPALCRFLSTSSRKLILFCNQQDALAAGGNKLEQLPRALQI